ncbi:copper chaperone NosL [Salinihabitans flavidus]|uniref:Copper chaperone NosL n=1 Tax=Salinihabitans flavidus TaxID=569882 RepID=A0A1H8S167_9RHOB|nr:nitrous oxide reductase accessory protein NosL [Salinihabitans flavidus]SEO71923.1 copper chaperone NosL [Salinihabitans flavidus]
MKRLVILLCLLALAACREEAAPPPDAVSLNTDAVGHFCQMTILEHPGPKAQVHLEGLPGAPLFFSQVRDAIAYQRMPEQEGVIRAIHVNDMGAAPSWQSPGADNWILADQAHYVVGSERTGGMGAPELVPFADAGAAREFAARHGGKVAMLDEIPDAAVLEAAGPGVAGGDVGDEDDFAARLRKLSNERQN